MIPLTTPTVGLDGGIGDWVNFAVTAAIGLGAVITLLNLLRGGFAYMVAGSSKDRVEGARQIILNSIIGMIILSSAFVFWQLILNMLNLDSLFQIV